MLKVILPDGKTLDFSHRVRPADIAAQIGPRLAKATLAAEVDGRLVDASELLPADGQVKLRLLTAKDPEALGLLRHSCAHVMARAVMRLFDDVQLAFGPTVADGFYYDFDMKHKLSEEDFPKIEAEMAKIVKESEPFERVEMDRSQAIELCRDLKQSLKVEHLDEGRLSEEKTVSFYRQGEFMDLCRGPHLPSAGAIGAFKLLSVAGAYWKGDASRQQLQRLYGTAFFSKQELDEHLRRQDEAKRRDHRVLGKQLELFFIDPAVGSGLVFWLPKGAVIRHELENFLHGELIRRGYQPVNTPVIGNVHLYQTSGHYPYYADSQFPPICLHPFAAPVQELLMDRRKGRSDEELISLFEKYVDEEVPAHIRPSVPDNWKSLSTDEKFTAIQAWLDEQERYLLRPMNCPHHVTIYKSKPRSYRELPLRLAEFGTVHRFEQSGELNGMTRVRGFTQDDAHIFCTEEQVADEFRACLEMTQFVLEKLGLKDYRVRLGFRDPASDKYVGKPEIWQRAEAALEQVCRSMNLPDLHVQRGEAAFYGPKADFIVTDCIGRPWQLGTVQLDYNLPSKERFNLEYIGADNTPHQPVMIHRAPFGSFERFVGMLIEHFAGAFPLWLAPEQVRVMVVSQKVEEYGRNIERQLAAAGFRVSGDYRAEKIGAKIRDAQLELIPYMFVVGGREAEEGKVAVRDRIAGDLGAMPVAAAIERLQQEVKDKTLRSKMEGK
ncbi:MAG: threonine--tRNA ligase [Thermoguttaceae bacterium]